MTNKQKSLYKSISYRVISIIMTFSIAHVVTGNTAIAASIVGIDTILKVIFYYYHERAWSRIYKKYKTESISSQGMKNAHKQ